jgi:chorismate synthase
MCLNAIIEGIGAGYELDFDFINSQLALRQQGKGRGGRMQIEADSAKFKSGVRFGKTTGAPVCIEIENRDFENWKIPMSVEPVSDEVLDKVREKEIHLARPGHADFAGALKYGHEDIRDVLERSSARETATRVAVGAVAQDILRKFGIVGEAKVMSIGLKSNDADIDNVIEVAKAMGETLGGRIEVLFSGLPVGLGSYVHWDRRLDGLLAQALMSIPAIKSVEIGLGATCGDLTGSNVQDELFFEEGRYFRRTNRAGGIEGGMTNGEDIIIRASMKPIPTQKKALQSVNIKTKEAAKAHFERSDTCAVEACAIVAVNMAAIVLLGAFMEKFGADNYENTKKRYEEEMHGGKRL